MPELVLHEQTAAAIERFAARPAHAVLLVGPEGAGKGAIAQLLAAQVLGISEQALEGYPYSTSVQPEKGTISIEVIRELQKFLQLKTVGDRPLRRVVIVEHADALTIEAQNAYLKLLEEPPADTLLILTAAHQQSLLPTILSRVQLFSITLPLEMHLKEYFRDQDKDAQAITQAYFLSGGLPGLMTALLSDHEAHPLMASVEQAKTLLRQSTFERLAQVDSLSKQREAAQMLLEALTRIAQTGLEQAAAKQEPARLKQWHHILKEANTAREALRHNGNAKLVLSNILLHM